MAIKHHMYSTESNRDVSLAIKSESLVNTIETIETIADNKENLKAWLMSGEIPGSVTCLSQIYKKYLDDVTNQKEKSSSTVMLANIAIGARAIKVCAKLTSVIKVRLVVPLT